MVTEKPRTRQDGLDLSKQQPKFPVIQLLGDIDSGGETRDVNVSRRGLHLQRRVGREDVNNSVPLLNSEGGGGSGKTVAPENHVSVWGSLGGPEFRGPRRLPMTGSPALLFLPHLPSN